MTNQIHHHNASIVGPVIGSPNLSNLEGVRSAGSEKVSYLVDTILSEIFESQPVQYSLVVGPCVESLKREGMLACGNQFKVLRRGGEVEKIPRSYWEITRSFIARNPEIIFRPNKLRRRALRTIERRDQAIQILKEGDTDRSLLANLRFENGKIFQDLAIPLAQAPGSADKLIRAYLDTTARSLRCGMLEMSFNVLDNFGVTNSGSGVVLDIGDLIFDREQVLEFVKNQKWQDAIRRTCGARLNPLAYEKLLGGLERLFTTHTITALWPNP